MYKCNSTDNMVIGKEMVNNYGIVDINCDNYVANEIAMFNSLFLMLMMNYIRIIISIVI